MGNSKGRFKSKEEYGKKIFKEMFKTSDFS